MGSFSGRGWIHVAFLLPYALVGLALAAGHHRELDILALGEEQSHHLGVSVLGSGSSCCWAPRCSPPGRWPVSGVIGFVGLVVPHLVRVLAGPSHGRLLVLSAFAGALILMGRRGGPGPVGWGPGTAGGRGHGPVGRAVFLLSAQIPAHQGDVVIRVTDLNLGYEQRPVLTGLNFRVNPGGVHRAPGSQRQRQVHPGAGPLRPAAPPGRRHHPQRPAARQHDQPSAGPDPGGGAPIQRGAFSLRLPGDRPYGALPAPPKAGARRTKTCFGP